LPNSLKLLAIYGIPVAKELNPLIKAGIAILIEVIIDKNLSPKLKSSLFKVSKALLMLLIAINIDVAPWADVTKP
jgi:hypothetical protein